MYMLVYVGDTLMKRARKVRNDWPGLFQERKRASEREADREREIFHASNFSVKVFTWWNYRASLKWKCKQAELSKAKRRSEKHISNVYSPPFYNLFIVSCMFNWIWSGAHKVFLHSTEDTLVGHLLLIMAVEFFIFMWRTIIHVKCCRDCALLSFALLCSMLYCLPQFYALSLSLSRYSSITYMQMGNVLVSIRLTWIVSTRNKKDEMEIEIDWGNGRKAERKRKR